MKKLPVNLKKKLDELRQVIKRDKVYIFLLLILAVIASHNLAYKPESVSSHKIESYKTLHGDMDDLLKDFKITPKFKKLLSVLVMFIVIGFIMLVINFFRFIRKYFFLPREYNPPNIMQIENYKKLYPWGLWDICKILVIFFIAYLCFSTVQELIIEIVKVDRDTVNYNFLFIMDMFFAELVAVFFVFRFMGNYNISIRQFGIKFSDFFSSVLKGVSSYLMFLPVYLVLVIATNLLSKMFDIKMKPQEVLSLLTDESKFTSSQFMAVVIFITVLGPIFEEIFFRGFLYRWLRKNLGVFWGLSINAVLFSLIHNNMMAFLPIVFLGIILSVLVEKTSSLVPSIIMHIMVNSVSVLMVLSLTG
ncbi:CPBP family intramembrane metalloprotease [bacterium]|nr:CPBP family intramembrane metalloprotease [bacterium]